MGSNKSFFSETKPVFNRRKVESIIRRALAEDIGRGDITTRLIIPAAKKVSAAVIVNQDCLVCGLPVVEKVFKIADRNIRFVPLVGEGRQVKKGRLIAKVYGNARSILTAERVALNILSMLSGVATKTREFVKETDKYKVKVSDTRKTLPGLRELQKYAVRVGGGYNHRMSLDEMVLIKDNHLKVITNCAKLPNLPKGHKVEIEVKNLREFKQALRFKPDLIMLDNMSIREIKKAVRIRNNSEFKSPYSRTKLEISGGVNLKTIKKIAAAGVDIISVGALTHSLKAIDISLEVL